MFKVWCAERQQYAVEAINKNKNCFSFAICMVISVAKTILFLFYSSRAYAFRGLQLLENHCKLQVHTS